MGRAIDMEKSIDKLKAEVEGLKSILNDILELVKGDEVNEPEEKETYDERRYDVDRESDTADGDDETAE